MGSSKPGSAAFPPKIERPRFIREFACHKGAENGIEAMPEGGTLTIVSGRQAGWVFVHVSDAGEGITQEVMGKIFQSFFSTKPKGSGLGLAISLTIIEAHRGKITIETKRKCR
jgi:signal transduction histidine kinase